MAQHQHWEPDAYWQELVGVFWKELCSFGEATASDNLSLYRPFGPEMVRKVEILNDQIPTTAHSRIMKHVLAIMDYSVLCFFLEAIPVVVIMQTDSWCRGLNDRRNSDIYRSFFSVTPRARAHVSAVEMILEFVKEAANISAFFLLIKSKCSRRTVGAAMVVRHPTPRVECTVTDWQRDRKTRQIHRPGAPWLVPRSWLPTDTHDPVPFLHDR